MHQAEQVSGHLLVVGGGVGPAVDGEVRPVVVAEGTDQLDVMTALAREGMTMMCVTHEMGFARRVAHRVVFMDEGQVVEEGTPDEFFRAPKSDRGKQFLSKILTH